MVQANYVRAAVNAFVINEHCSRIACNGEPIVCACDVFVCIRVGNVRLVN